MNNIFVCDTNVFISSLLAKNSTPAKVVEFIERNGFFAFSQDTFSELGEVLQRKKFDKITSPESRKAFHENISLLSAFFPISTNINLCRDPKDNKFLDIALASSADYLITGDDDLLVLEKIGNTPIVTPRYIVEIFNLT